VNTFFKLPLVFYPSKAAEDLQIYESMRWTSHFNAKDYSGEWDGIALRSASGAAADILSHPDSGGYRDTPLLGRCPYFAEILSLFDCEKESVRLLRLAPGARIKEHKDVHAGYQYDFVT
jgi:hypothetical protein